MTLGSTSSDYNTRSNSLETTPSSTAKLVECCQYFDLIFLIGDQADIGCQAERGAVVPGRAVDPKSSVPVPRPRDFVRVTFIRCIPLKTEC